jgi:hypothetical protein
MRWESKYEQRELEERYAIVLDQVSMAHSSQRVTVDVERFSAEGESWLYALELVPTHLLREAFRRAIQSHEGTYALAAGEVVAKWREIEEEAQSGYQASYRGQLQLPPPPESREDYTSFAAFKQRRGLPPDWRPPGLSKVGKWPVPGHTQLPVHDRRSKRQREEVIGGENDIPL